MSEFELLVKPMYGFGWFSRTAPIPVPAIFTLKKDADFCRGDGSFMVGQILDVGHVYEHWWAVLSVRTQGPEGNTYNVVLCKKHPNVKDTNDITKSMIDVSGFAEIEEID